MDIDLVTLLFESALAGGCLLVVCQLLISRASGQARLPLLLLFAGIFVAQVGSMLINFGLPGVSDVSLLLELPGEFLCYGAFWIYVIVMTSAHPEGVTKRIYWHLWVVPVAAFLTLPVLWLPAETRYALMKTGDVEGAAVMRAVIPYVASQVLWLLWSGVYLWKVVRRMAAYRIQLRAVHSSTEQREMLWISGLVGVLSLYWLAVLWDTSGLFDSGLEVPDRVGLAINVLVVWIPALWGLRQRPGLVDVKAEVAVDEELPETATAKYDQSGLNLERLQKLADKIDKAMKEDQLYLDPDLSLGQLANCLGTSSNYVSQALNTLLGESFFGYVNHWRTRHAENELRTTNHTVLRITYDCGFNSRSSFYNAFKKHFDCSPSAYRKKSINDEREGGLIEK